jgi:hypothetical protein
MTEQRGPGNDLLHALSDIDEQRDRAERAEAENARLRAEIASLRESCDGDTGTCVCGRMMVFTKVRALAMDNTRLRKINAELVDLLEAAMIQGCCSRRDDAIWSDTMAISTWQDIGEQLVKLGGWECDARPAGRRLLYRPIAKAKGTE